MNAGERAEYEAWRLDCTARQAIKHALAEKKHRMHMLARKQWAADALPYFPVFALGFAATLVLAYWKPNAWTVGVVFISLLCLLVNVCVVCDIQF